MRPRLSSLVIGVATLALAPQAAEAHLVATGMGPVYDGIVHFGVDPQDCLPIAAFALYIGLRGPRPARWSLMALTAGWLLGGLAGTLIGSGRLVSVFPPLTAAMMLAVGGLLAGNVAIDVGSCAAIAFLIGALRGCAGAAGSAASALSVLGMAATALVVFALAASLTLQIRRFWTVIAVRVVGSWLAAVGLLFAGWIWRYGVGVS